MDIEEIAEEHPDRLMRMPVDIRHGFDAAAVAAALPASDAVAADNVVATLGRLYQAYVDNDAELMEINPLVVTRDGHLMALDCKFTLDDSAIKRRQELAEHGTPDKLTGLEAKAKDIGFKYIELDGNVRILANGAGLTMTSMDAVRHYGGNPANFLEIGGEAYSLGKEALETVLANPNVKSLLINFCGAFARTDVMVEGIVKAWKVVQPDVPVFFTIHGTGEDEAIAMVREELGIEPFDIMDDAVKAAVGAAR
jgi:succinyl-CoA synthetase beta subunit